MVQNSKKFEKTLMRSRRKRINIVLRIFVQETYQMILAIAGFTEHSCMRRTVFCSGVRYRRLLGHMFLRLLETTLF